MVEESLNTWMLRFQSTVRRLFDARPFWLFGSNPLPEPDDSTESITESFRTLGANLRIHAGDSFRTIMLTSPAPGEGKSMTAANLAAILTRQNPSVLLVDADFRRPVLHRVFQLPGDLGLSDVLKGEVEPDRAIQQTQGGVKLLPSGKTPDEPGLLLGSGRMRELIADLSRKYQIILFDAPPVFSATDAALLAPLVDWTVLVLRSGTTIMEEARRAKVMLETANGKVLGSVLNSLDSEFAPAYHKYANYYTESSGKT
jgi:protein-tyrosine kinase